MEEIGSVTLCPNCSYDQNTEPASPHHLKPGTILQDKYLIGKVLGQGGFGITYLAWDTVLDLKIAVKEFFPLGLVARSYGGSTIDIYGSHYKEQFNFGKDRFLSEAKTLARFSEHPNIITVRDFFEANDTAYMVMNYIEGGTLEEYLAQAGGKLPYSKMLDIMMPVMDALREVHEAGFLHRDVSPDNIFIRKDGRVILIDFGAARQELQSQSRSLSVLLKTGYSPEEQYRSKGEQGPWTDIYAVSATIYRGVTGQLPPEAMDRLALDELKPPSQLDVEITEAQEEALLKGLAVKAKDRFQSVSDFQHALMSISVDKADNKEAENFGETKETALTEDSLKSELNHSGKPKDESFSSRILEKAVAPKNTKVAWIGKNKKAFVLLLAALVFLTTGLTAAHFYYPIYELNLEPNKLTLVAGEDLGNFTLKAKPFFANLNNLKWDTDLDNRQYASIIKFGVIEPHKAGTRNITVSTNDGSVSSSLEINVVHPTISWDGGTYTGELEDGMPHGEGEWVSQGGEWYSGEWREGLFHGKGEWEHPSGESYNGRWLRGEYSGDGLWSHPSGERYEGRWLNGLFHGNGTWWGPDGDKFEGRFSEGKWHGRGKYTSSDGKTEKWIWDNGEKISNYISSVEAEVTGLRIFETSYEYNPNHGNRFQQSKARYIGWSLDFDHTSSSSDRYVNITTKYLRSDGSTFQEHSDSFKFEKHHIQSTWSQWWGYEFAGNWPKGQYRLELIAEGRVIASGSFEVH